MRLSKISVYPVKGCTAIDRTEAVVQPWGLVDDRRWLIANPDGMAITQRDVATLALLRAEPDLDGLKLSFPRLDPHAVAPGAGLRSVTIWGTTLLAMNAGPEADAWISEALGRPCHLVWLDDPARRSCAFADGSPLLLANEASLTRVNDWILEGDCPDEAPLPMTRFRPNVVISGAKAFAEDEWIGRTIQIGQVAFLAESHCGRCIVTTTDQGTGDRGREPLRTLARHRNVDQKLRFGVNLVPQTQGTVRVGDDVTVLAT